MTSFHDKLLRFVEAEKQTGLDQELLDQLHELMGDELLYWDLPPERRNSLNAFFKEIHSQLDKELLQDKYGASSVIDGIIVMVFEIGYKLGMMEAPRNENHKS